MTTLTNRLSIMSALTVCMLISSALSPAYAANIGTPLTPKISVATLASDAYANHVAVDASGNFVVVWTPPSTESGVPQPLTYRRFAADGTPLTGAISLDSTSAGTYSALAMDSAGDFVIAWSYYDTNTPQTPNVYAQVFAPDGTAFGDPIVVASGPARGKFVVQSNIGPVSAAMTSSGDFIIGWSGHVFYGTGSSSIHDAVTSEFVRTRKYHLDGSAYGAASTVVSKIYPLKQTAQMQLDDLRMNASGSYVVTYSTQSGYFANFYASNGAVTTSSKSPSKGSATAVQNFVCAPSADSDVFCAWEVLNSSQSGAEVDVVRYGSDGSTKSGPLVAVASPTASPKGGLDLQPTVSGGVLLSWAVLTSSNGEDIQAQAYTADLVAIADPFIVASAVTLSAYSAADLSIAVTSSDDLVFVWGGVFAQLFQGP